MRSPASLPARPRTAALALALAALAATGGAGAQGFAAYITPPRFEVAIKPGERLRQVVEIQHVGQQKGGYRVYTNDWTFMPDNSLRFSNDLAPDSCRPWVAIERRELTIEPGQRYRYRFEISPPPGTEPRECRFALMFEGADPARVSGPVNFPVGGRVAVIVYASIGGAQPQLSVVGTRVAQVNGKPVAIVDIRNSGNAHGRIDGFLDAVDASGRRAELSPADLPVLPGETRGIALMPVPDASGNPPVLSFPLDVKGQLEWRSERLPLNARFGP